MGKKLNLGDVISTSVNRDAGWQGRFINKGIRWANQSLGEPPTLVSHTAMVYKVGQTIKDTMLLEQTYPKQRIVPLLNYQGSPVYVSRRFSLSALEAERLVTLGTADIGRAYGVGKIALFLADSLVGKAISLPIWGAGKLVGKNWKGVELPLFSRLDVTKDFVCSQTVAKYYWQLGYHLGDFWLHATPDSILDYTSSSSEWESWKFDNWNYG